MFNSTLPGLEWLNTPRRMGFELASGLLLAGFALVRQRFVWLLALLWTLVLMLPYAALFSASEMMLYLKATALPIPDRYLYLITAGIGYNILA